MKSEKSYRLLDLQSDPPTNREDVIALRRAREAGKLSFSAYLEFLSNFPQPSVAKLRSRRGPTGIRPFEL
jgi:hypothetical protein